MKYNPKSNELSTLWIADNENPAIMSKDTRVRPKEYHTLQKRRKNVKEQITLHLLGGSKIWFISTSTAPNSL